MKITTSADFEKKARYIRRQILEMIVSSGKGHIGGAFSCTDILVALYYGGFLHIDPKKPDWKERDRFILSKGHSGVVLYALLSDLGFFSQSELKSFCQNGSMLGGHPDKRIPGVEADTGSLGHGLGIGAGLALSGKMDNKSFITVVMLGDGECYEGSVWEAAMFAGHHGLGKLIAVIDRNQHCVTDCTEDCNRLEPLKDKWLSFGWDVATIDGHSFKEIVSTLKNIHDRPSDRPLAIIAHTVKGKGVSFMEGTIKWHHGIPTEQELAIARKELSYNE
ncbi:MAG: transketolase [Candidatus Omnitrophica bacterium]|nr:transketolase [Candidatus Omnitrophota bacterium]